MRGGGNCNHCTLSRSNQRREKEETDQLITGHSQAAAAAAIGDYGEIRMVVRVRLTTTHQISINQKEFNRTAIMSRLNHSYCNKSPSPAPATHTVAKGER